MVLMNAGERLDERVCVSVFCVYMCMQRRDFNYFTWQRPTG